MIEIINHQLPGLSFERAEHPGEVTTITMPEQERLAFELSLEFGADEITLIAPEFHWHFSMRDEEDVRDAESAFLGLASGDARILIERRRGKVSKSRLQFSVGDNWADYIVTGVFRLPYGHRTIDEVRNKPTTHPQIQ